MEVAKKENIKPAGEGQKVTQQPKEDFRKKLKLPMDEEIKLVKLKPMEKDVVNRVFKTLWDLGKFQKINF
jgi:hypothetical protein